MDNTCNHVFCDHAIVADPSLWLSFIWKRLNDDPLVFLQGKLTHFAYVLVSLLSSVGIIEDFCVFSLIEVIYLPQGLELMFFKLLSTRISVEDVSV